MLRLRCLIQPRRWDTFGTFAAGTELNLTDEELDELAAFCLRHLGELGLAPDKGD